jgi:hypothetical protein
MYSFRKPRIWLKRRGYQRLCDPLRRPRDRDQTLDNQVRYGEATVFHQRPGGRQRNLRQNWTEPSKNLLITIYFFRTSKQAISSLLETHICLFRSRKTSCQERARSFWNSSMGLKPVRSMSLAKLKDRSYLEGCPTVLWNLKTTPSVVTSVWSGTRKASGSWMMEMAMGRGQWTELGSL